MSAKFEVGKRVIAIKTTQRNSILKGKIYELLAIKKDCCEKSKIMLLVEAKLNSPYTICRRCGTKQANGEAWFESSFFKPIDDTLSELTDSDILYSETEILTPKI